MERAVPVAPGVELLRVGLKVESALDTRTYEKGIKVSDAEMNTLD